MKKLTYKLLASNMAILLLAMGALAIPPADPITLNFSKVEPTIYPSFYYFFKSLAFLF